MPCIRIDGSTIVCCSYGVFKYKGFYFEWHRYFGPYPLRKDGEASQRIPKGFWDMVKEFQDLTEAQRGINEKFKTRRE